ncbi:uncharacterized protein LOC131066953 [Cryptomeria japonica]|uniref:uncharacterized protein LOC131066953 n=1 Tax=Cryptomeria japonica TaxID=3369 RepID=UPI0027DAA75A|nr:uncharacterized protein LOC131066953 [Cryptomeria japonica]
MEENSQLNGMKCDFYDEMSGSGNEYDAIVVGSGYGGSVAACRLSQAGLKVCLLEKGRKWEAEDFPTNSLQAMLATRIETPNLGCYGSKTALFQVIKQEDSVAMVCSGLGGGSLINAGVMAPTPMRARRDPRWPKEWEGSWSSSQARAIKVLQPETIPHQFPSSKVMRDISGEIEESTLDPIQTSIKFDQGESSAGLHQNACMACGNCLSGCPYNSKGSTDKNYLALAIEAGCEIKTECQVRFIVENLEESLQTCCCRSMNKRPKRRWRVHLDELQYLSSDFVILSAGVLGTAEILLQSRKRGLGLSERLGLGVSCNGNNMAYVVGSNAPLNGYGLNKQELAYSAKALRPGPAITASYTSSLGFTIQSGIVPTAYPYLLIRRMGSYGWPRGHSLVESVIETFKHLTGKIDSQGLVLNMMGFDDGDGKISLDITDRIQLCPPHDTLLPRKTRAFQKLAKRLGGILFMSKFRSTSVHLLGGGNAAHDPSLGVANPSGQVFNPYSGSSKTQVTYPKPGFAVHSGLYVCDASLIPCAVGLNPSLTISTVAEYVSVGLVVDALKFKTSTKSQFSAKIHFHDVDRIINTPIDRNPISVDSQIFDQNTEEDAKFIVKTAYAKDRQALQSPAFNGVIRKPEVYDIKQMQKEVSGPTFRESMNGKLGGMPCALHLVFKMNPWGSGDLGCKIRGFGDDHPLLRGEVGGYMQMKSLHKDNIYIVGGTVNMCWLNPRTPYTQYMHYHLLLSSASGARYILEGKKTMHPFLFCCFGWKESTTLHAKLRQITRIYQNYRVANFNADLVELEGDLKVSAIGLLQSLISLRGNWKGKFVSLLGQSLIRTYILQRPREVLSNAHCTAKQSNYPCHVLHKITAGDGFPFSCKQWKCSTKSNEFDCPTKNYPVLLLNGHSTESFCLPTEPMDFVRTLLDEGYEAWLLQNRLHPLHSSNEFTIEDLAKFDIPAAMARITEIHGPDIKVHVIAHCVGGLAIHMALLGGYISAHNVASLVCTNSSMFFKVTTSAFIKLMLPLMPISMAILGKKTVLEIPENSKEEWRHKLLKYIAKAMPRTERCTLDECEVFSGIFGSTFWHDNVSSTMHHWLYKQALPRLPMADFPHLRSICIAGHIVDSKGNNSFLIHPERMPLPTTYISGGRSILVTPETSLLANQFMKLHQPDFHHERVVVEGFGHSDLLIGENSHKHVFPHILSHLKTAERCSQGCEHVKDPSYAQASVSWERSPSFFGPYHHILYICLAFFLVRAFDFIFRSIFVFH